LANELTLSISVQYAKNQIGYSKSLNTRVTVTSNPAVHDVQSIGTSEEALALGEVSPSGYALFYNSDATNYVEIGNATGSYQLKLKAGEFALLRLDSWSAIYAKAHTAAVLLEYYLFSD
jgi:hypothetical protein